MALALGFREVFLVPSAPVGPQETVGGDQVELVFLDDEVTCGPCPVCI